MHSPTDVLRAEHEVILQMLEALDASAAKLRGGERVPAELLTTLCEFFSAYADRIHHAKEEHELFPKLEELGIPNQGGPIGVMLAEHVEGRGLVAELREAASAHAAGDGGAAEAWAGAAGAYAGLLRAHIGKENEVLFPTADQVLGPADREGLAAAFAAADRQTGDRSPGDWVAEAGRVCAALGVQAAT